jgi:hypothetical protein
VWLALGLMPTRLPGKFHANWKNRYHVSRRENVSTETMLYTLSAWSAMSVPFGFWIARAFFPKTRAGVGKSTEVQRSVEFATTASATRLALRTNNE